MELLTTLLFVYAGLLVINAVFSALSYRYYHDRLYLYSLYLWLGSLGTGILEGLFQGTHLGIILSFSTHFFCSIILVQILAFVTHSSIPLKKYIGWMGACILCTLLASKLGAGFTLMALPTVIGITTPMIHGAIKALLSKQPELQNRGIRAYCALLLINSLHLLDFPFLRLNPDFALIGFTVAVGLLMALSIFLPSFIIKNITERYTNDVSDLNRKLLDYQNQLSEVMSLAQVGELSFGFVHDMASPIILLLHYSKEISAMHGAGVPTGDKILPYSKGIEKATSRLMDLQQMFRDLIKNNVADKPAPVDLRASLQNCADLYRPFLFKHGIEIEATLTSDAAVVNTLPGVIERVVLNLLQNAANALADSPTKKVSLTLTANADSYTILLGDTGPGIPAERLARLWERFGHSETAKKNQAGASGASSRSGGSGFGLYKVKQLVDSLQGSITVDTSPRGTTFRIELPKTAAQASGNAA
jgi:signal transduction histidine kinase